jgi:outer membrane protein assembly factor BamA
VSARLSVGKDLTNDLSLVYAQNLAGPRNQSWILNYSTVKDFVVRAINRPDQDEVRLEFRHGFELGGGPPLPGRIAPRMEPLLGNVSFSMTALSDEDLRNIVAKSRSPYSVNRMSEDTEALVKLFAEKGYPDIKIRPTRQANGDVVDVRFNLDQGLKTTFDFRGNNTDVPDEIKKELLQVWIDGRAEATSQEEGVAVLLRHFRDEGYLDARVTVTNESQNPAERLYVFQIETGRKYRDPKWVFQGIEPMDMTDSPGTVIAKPDLIQQRIESSLREKGYLDAKVQPPVLDLNNSEPRFIVNVDLGKQYRVGNVNYEGNDTFPDTHLSGVVILGPTVIITSDEVGAPRPPPKEKQLLPFPYDADWLGTARRRILTEYWQFGFNDVQITPSTHYEPGSGVIDVTFDIKEGEEQKLHHIRVMGDERTLRSHVSRYFKIFSGDPIDYSRISLTRKRLYDTGLFKRVDIQIVKEPEGNVAELNLNERAPWSIRYGFTVTDRKENDVRDRDLGISTGLTHRNLWGVGITSGLSFKADTTLREARIFSSFPVFMNREITTTFSLFRNREALPDVVTKATGFTVKQQRRLHDYYLLSYDYNYRRVGTIEIDKTEDDPEIVDGVVPVARFNGTLTRDTRDDLFNATRGTFFSNSLDFAPPGIGSSVRYVRNYTQYLRFREVRPNLVWASAYRLGLARGFGGSNLVPADRFTAGGPTSLRAFSQDKASLQPGNALFVTNQELRYPLFWKFGAVAFFDVGNVYPGFGSVKVLEQRYSPGVGIRIDTPFVLLRVDLGLNLWPRTGEDKRRISFGIGQAF